MLQTDNKPISRWRVFQLVTLPNIIWHYLGGKLWYEAKSYWPLNIKKEPPLWEDVSQDDCKERYCMHCGKGK